MTKPAVRSRSRPASIRSAASTSRRTARYAWSTTACTVDSVPAVSPQPATGVRFPGPHADDPVAAPAQRSCRRDRSRRDGHSGRRTLAAGGRRGRQRHPAGRARPAGCGPDHRPRLRRRSRPHCDGKLLVGNVDADTFAGSVTAYTPSGRPVGPVAESLSGAFAHVVDADGNVLVSGGFADDFSSTVVAVPASGTPVERARGYGFTTEMSFDPMRDETLVLDAAGVSTISALCRDRDGDRSATPTTTVPRCRMPARRTPTATASATLASVPVPSRSRTQR